MPQAGHLNAMPRSEVFLSCFRAVDEVVRTPYYLDDFTLVQPGYHDGGPGKRILYVGAVPEIGDSMASITAFLDVMEFESRADRTNAVAAALTTLLRHHWLGEKPLYRFAGGNNAQNHCRVDCPGRLMGDTSSSTSRRTPP